MLDLQKMCSSESIKPHVWVDSYSGKTDISNYTFLIVPIINIILS